MNINVPVVYALKCAINAKALKPMIKIHSTKKLFAKLPLDGNGALINTGDNADPQTDTDSPLGDWHANLLILQRHNCILFVHDATRFPVFIKVVDSDLP